MIGIIDYGLGNISAFQHIYQKQHIPVSVIQSSDQITDSISRFILPGVGSFDWAMHLLVKSGMRSELERRVLDCKIPVLGVCVGMQLLFESSDEGDCPGLGWVKGSVVKLGNNQNLQNLRLPHMGWNNTNLASNTGLFEGLGADPDFYFLHSFVAVPEQDSDSIATTTYHVEFTAAIQSGNILGTQFHPEKSHNNGIMVLSNFGKGIY